MAQIVRKQEPRDIFFIKYKRLHLCEPYKFYCEHCVFCNLNSQNTLLRVSQVHSHILHLETDKTWVREKCQTWHHWQCHSMFKVISFFGSYWFRRSEAAMTTEKEAVSRNLSDFKADGLHIRHSVSSVIRKQVLGRPRDKWSSAKIHYLQVSKCGCCIEDC